MAKLRIKTGYRLSAPQSNTEWPLDVQPKTKPIYYNRTRVISNKTGRVKLYRMACRRQPELDINNYF